VTQPARGVTDRLPDPGAGFVWSAELEGSLPLLRPATTEAVAAFTTRVGGASRAPFDSLNLSMKIVDELGGDPVERGSARENRSRVARAAGVDLDWAVVRQVHGASVLEVGSGAGLPDADGSWTPRNETLAVLSADCVLGLFIGDREIAVAHAGWRGTVAGVVENAARAVDAHTVYLGPAIGPCCFEVGPEVVAAFRERFADSVASDERHVDLWSAVDSAARGVGVVDVFSARLCTSCHADLFFSHRRDRGLTGRQGLIARRAP